MIDIRGGRTGFGTARPMSGVRTGSGTPGTGTHTVPLTGNLFSRVRTGLGTSDTGVRAVPLTGNSFHPLPTIPVTMTLVVINSGTFFSVDGNQSRSEHRDRTTDCIPS